MRKKGNREGENEDGRNFFGMGNRNFYKSSLMNFISFNLHMKRFFYGWVRMLLGFGVKMLRIIGYFTFRSKVVYIVRLLCSCVKSSVHIATLVACCATFVFFGLKVVYSVRLLYLLHWNLLL